MRRQALEGPPPPPPADRASLSYRFVALSEDLPESPAATALFRDYTAATGKANLAAQAQKTCPAPPPGALHYAGVASCKDCHPQAFEVYAGTGHVHAYQKLVDKGRQYDLDCIGCHVVGYGKPGGVCRLDRVSGLDNVQCESCHGMGSAHAESGGDTAMPNAKPGYDTCLQCHNPDNDTGFNRERFVSHYLPLVLGPGHGRPAAKR